MQKIDNFSTLSISFIQTAGKYGVVRLDFTTLIHSHEFTKPSKTNIQVLGICEIYIRPLAMEFFLKFTVQ